MQISNRVKDIPESITLKLNAKAVELQEQGKQVYNLTAGQLPFRPMNEFVDQIKGELNFVKSFQYAPVVGFPELRKKVIRYFEESRNVSLEGLDIAFDAIISNGAKHSITNVLDTLLDAGDEVIIISPYWISYKELIKLSRGVPVVVESNIFDFFIPAIEEFKKKIGPKTKAIMLNSPNNPTGTHYSQKWMDEFGEFMLQYPDITIISDEIYFEVSYFDPKPTYFYQKYPQLLKQTVIIDGISKSLAATGLRIGWCIAPKYFVSAMARLQGQTTSSANSLMQRALTNLDFGKIETYLAPIKEHLRNNSRIIREKMRDAGLASSWYQTTSAFYFMIDFSGTPVFKKYSKGTEDKADYADQICSDVLEEFGVALVPGSDFGLKNTARLSLVIEEEAFKEAMTRMIAFLIK